MKGNPAFPKKKKHSKTISRFQFSSFRIYSSKFLTAEWDWWAFRTGSASTAFLATISCNICFRYLLMMSSKASWCSSKEIHSSIKKQNNLALMSTDSSQSQALNSWNFMTHNEILWIPNCKSGFKSTKFNS